MRKVIASLNITLDGYIAGPENDLDWHFPLWNDDMYLHAREQLLTMSTIILGRVTYQSMADYWPTAPVNDFTTMMNTYEKVVFSHTLKETSWNNTRLAGKTMREEVKDLKQQEGDNIIIYGSGSLIQSFINNDLIDEYRLWVHPVVIGKGVPLFENSCCIKLHLLRTKVFSSGVVMLYYQPLRA